MDKEEKQLLQEYNAEDKHKKALAVCELVTQCKSLRTALTLQGLAASDFYRIRREHKDVEQAWADAQQLLAELKLGDLSDLSDRLIQEEGLTHNTFTAVTKNERWLVEKLDPDRYGAHPHNDQHAFVQNNVQILQQLTDEQIMRLAAVPVYPAVPAQNGDTLSPVQKTLDTTAEVIYDKDVSGGVVRVPFTAGYDNESINFPYDHKNPAGAVNTSGDTDAKVFPISSAEVAPEPKPEPEPEPEQEHEHEHEQHKSNAAPASPIVSSVSFSSDGGYDLSAFGDFT